VLHAHCFFQYLSKLLDHRPRSTARGFFSTIIFALTCLSGTNAHAYNDGVDIISLHYDFAPDRDDAHASVAAKHLLDTLGIAPIVVTGATGDGNRSQYIEDSIRFQNVVWGPTGYIQAMGQWDQAVAAVAALWTDAFERGGKVFVAESGQSDFTYDVIKLLTINDSFRSAQKDLNFVKRNTAYKKIADGNSANSTADLNQKSDRFVQWAKSSSHANLWNEAFSFLNPNKKLDFSDTVELLDILDVSLDQISSPDTFASYIDSISGSGDARSTTTVITDTVSRDSVKNSKSILVEAESFLSKDSRWQVSSIHTGGSGTYLELLPDTRVTQLDPLIPGQNFWSQPGEGPTIIYDINFPAPGEYRVAVNAYSTGTEDNGIHVGINGTWPASGARIQWCNGKNQWTWSSAQRTASNHCGEPETISINVPQAGVNQVMFSAREDGFEFDQFRLTALTANTLPNAATSSSPITREPLVEDLEKALATSTESLPSNEPLDNPKNASAPGHDFIRIESLRHFANDDQCIVSAKSLGAARLRYAQQCSLPRIDCDPYKGTWYCASAQIGPRAPKNANSSKNATTFTTPDVITSEQLQTNDTFILENTLDTATEILPSAITDLIVITGQFSLNPLDSKNTDTIQNNIGLYFGRRLAELDENIVVGYVLAAEADDGIYHLDSSAAEMQQKALEAINQLPHKSTIDGVLWHEGEAPQQTQNYPTNLAVLVDTLRLKAWFGESAPVICAETLNAATKEHLDQLNKYSDPKTACVTGADLTRIISDSNRLDTNSLRTLGERYAESYFLLRQEF